MQNDIKNRIHDSIVLKQKVLADELLVSALSAVVDVAVRAFQSGGGVYFCGNGGSAADAQHLAAEFSGRFYFDREPLLSEALHVNTSYLTAVANDYSYDVVFSRLVRAKVRKGDILMGLSTSGNSKNVVKAFEEARAKGAITVGFTGQGGGQLGAVSDYLLAIPSKDTPRIQECHMLLGHILCEFVEAALFPKHG